MESNEETTKQENTTKETTPINEVITIDKQKDELQEYRRAIENLARIKSDFVFPNSSPAHAAIVLSCILKYSCDVKIYDHNLDGDVSEQDEVFFNELKNFLSDNKKKLSITVRDNNFKRDSEACLKFKDLAHKYGNLEIRTATDIFKKSVTKLYEKDINFAVGDRKAFRMELVDGAIGSNPRKAICSFNKSSYAAKLSKVFEENFDKCTSISL
jgi:hypothetical protein